MSQLPEHLEAMMMSALADPAGKRVAQLLRRLDTDSVGAVAGSGVSLNEYGAGAIHVTKFTLEDVAIALADEAGVVAYGGLKFYDFPEGGILYLGGLTDLAITKSSAGVNNDWDGDFSVGTATASNNGTLTTTEDDLIPSTATPQAASGATTADGVSTASELAVFDGTDTAKDAYLNVLVDDADHNVGATPCNLIFNGTIWLSWIHLGDN